MKRGKLIFHAIISLILVTSLLFLIKLTFFDKNNNNNNQQLIAKSFTTSFNQQVLLVDDIKLLDKNNEQYYFDELLDKQITLFSKNILYRLFAVYGMSSSNFVHTYGSSNTEYKLGNTSATINKHNLFAYPIYDHDSTSPTYTYFYTENASSINHQVVFYINEVASYAYALAQNNGVWPTTTVASRFNLTHSIMGGYVWENETNSFDTMLLNNANAWLWNYDDKIDEIFSSGSNASNIYINRYLQEMKKGIANILSGHEEAPIAYTLAIKDIDTLKFTQDFDSKLNQFILSNVIGMQAVTFDNTYKPNSNLITAVTVMSTENHSYKAYELVVQGIVKQAINQTFDGTDESLWLDTDYVSNESINSVLYNSLESQNFGKIRIVPNKDNLDVTKIEIKIIVSPDTVIDIYYNVVDTNSTIYNGKTTTSTQSSITTINLQNKDIPKISKNGYIEFILKPKSNVDLIKVEFGDYYIYE